MSFYSYFILTAQIKKQRVLGNKVAIIGVFSFLMLFSAMPNSEAELWELIIVLNIPKSAINSGEVMKVTGRVVDHAYNPIENAEVLIRIGSDITKTITDQDGMFNGLLADFERIPGTYTINTIASLEGMTGLASIQFQVKGEISPTSILEEKLSSEYAKKYLNSQESDYEKDPIGQTLFKYYYELQKELELEQEKAKISLAEQMELEQKREISEELKSQDVEEYNSGAGTYEGYQYEVYIAGLSKEIKELVTDQLEFTKNLFEEGQKIKNEILANGGTYEEARQAYLDTISISKETLEEFNENKVDEQIEENSEKNENSDQKND